MADIYYDTVSVLIPFDEADGTSDEVADHSHQTLVTTLNGDAETDDQQQLFSENNMVTAVSGYAEVLTNDVFDMIDRPCTFECHVMIEADSIQDLFTERNALILGCMGNGGTALTGYELLFLGDASTTGTGVQFSTRLVGGNSRSWRFVTTFNKDQWYHIAYSREGDGTDHLFIDGVEVAASAVVAGAGYNLINDFDQPFRVMHSNISNLPWALIGRVCNVRVTRDACRYVSGFTPPAAPYLDTPPEDPDFSSVVNLLHFNDPSGATAIQDYGSVGGVWTAVAPAIVGPDGDFNTNGLDILSGTGQLSDAATTGADWKYLHDGTEAWTIDLTVELITTGANQVVFDTGGILNTTIGIGCAIRNTGTIELTVSDGVSYVATALSGVVISVGVVYQLGFTFTPGVGYEIFVDGISVATAADPLNQSTSDSTYVFLLGRYGAAASVPFRGHMDEFRITRGVDRYA